MTRRLTPSWRVRATLRCLVAPPLVHLIPLPRLIPAGPVRPSDPSVDDAALVDWVDRVLGRLPWPWRTTCLKRGVVLYALLRRAGRPADLIIGVRRAAEGALEAHAWLERAGVPVFEPPRNAPESYRAIDRYPGAAR